MLSVYEKLARGPRVLRRLDGLTTKDLRQYPGRVQALVLPSTIVV